MTPHDYDAAMELLADLRLVAIKAEANAPDESTRLRKHELAVRLDAALAIVRQAKENAGCGLAYNDLVRRVREREGGPDV